VVGADVCVGGGGSRLCGWWGQMSVWVVGAAVCVGGGGRRLLLVMFSLVDSTLAEKDTTIMLGINSVLYYMSVVLYV